MVQRVQWNAYGDGSKNYTAHIGMHSAPNYVYLLGMVMNTQTMVLVLGMVMNTDHGTFMEYTMLCIKALNLFGSRGVE